MGQRASTLDDHVYELKYASASLSRESRLSDSRASAAWDMCKEAQHKNVPASARMHSETCARHRKASLTCQRMSSRIEAIIQRVEMAIRMQSISQNMQGMVHGLSVVTKKLDISKMDEVMTNMEKQLEDVDMLVTSISERPSDTVQSSEVDSIMAEVADATGLEVAGGLPNVPVAQQQQHHHSVDVYVNEHEVDQERILDARLSKLGTG